MTTATRTKSATARLAALRAELETLREREAEARGVLARAVAEGVPPEEYAQARAALTAVTDRRAEIDLAIPLLEPAAEEEREAAGRARLQALEAEREELTAEVRGAWLDLDRLFHRWGREVLVPALEAYRALHGRAVAVDREVLRLDGTGVHPLTERNFTWGAMDRERAEDLGETMRAVEWYATKRPPLEVEPLDEATASGGGQ